MFATVSTTSLRPCLTSQPSRTSARTTCSLPTACRLACWASCPPTLAAFGNAPDALAVFVENEILPLMQRFRELNDWAGEELVRFAVPPRLAAERQ